MQQTKNGKPFNPDAMFCLYFYRYKYVFGSGVGI